MNAKTFPRIFLFIAFIGLKSLWCNEFDGFLEYEDKNENMVKIDLIEFINNGKKQMDTLINKSKIQKNAIMVLGLTGTGKTTLVNYLNGIPLMCVEINGAWKIDLESESNTLPGGFKIGHNENSETQFPAVYSPPGKDFSYFDNPGFQDNRGTAYEISNSFFREHAIQKTQFIKFLILITFQDLELKGQQFRSTIDRFCEMLGVFDNSENVKALSKSIAIIVTRVENKGKSDREIKAYISNKLLNVLKVAKKARKLANSNVELVIEEIISTNQIEVITRCEINFENKVIDNVQKNQVIALIDKLSYFDKEKAQFRLRIPPDEIEPVLLYIQERYELFRKEFETKFDKNLIDFVKIELDKTKTIDDLNKLQGTLWSIKESTNLFDNFLNYYDATLKLYFKNKKETLDYFAQLFGDKLQKHIYQNVFNELKHKMQQKINDQIELMNQMKKTESSTDDKGVRTLKSCYFKSSEIKNLYAHNVKSIVLYLCQAIYFDKNINLRGLIDSLIIIAPKWTVDSQNKVEVDMSGNNANYPSPANHANTVGSSGSDGEPGDLGQNGGKFFGFGNQFSNLDGGKGGMGQNGGSGVSSSNGETCTIPQWRPLNQAEIYQCNDMNFWDRLKHCRHKPVHLKVENNGGVNGDYINYGKVPSPGGNGGRGGKGGKGGLAGSAIIYKIDENLNTYFEYLKKIEGNNGKDGDDGAGGNGAPSGCKYKCKRTFHCDSLSCFMTYYKYEVNENWKNNLENFCEQGIHGQTPSDKNVAGLKYPSNSLTINNKNLELLMLEYSIEQRKNKYFGLLYPSFFNSLNKVIIQSELDEQIIQTHIEEFKMLDLIDYKNIHLKSLYHSLVYKTIKNKHILKEKSSNKQKIDFLDFLTTYGMSRINELQASDSALFIINLSDYVKIMLKNFETLQNFKGTEYKYLYRKEYTDLIESKISEANTYLKLLQQSIQFEYTNAELYMDKLDKEVENVISESKSNIESLQRTKRELEKARKKKFIFGILKLVVKSVGLMFLPYGPAISGVVLSGLNFAQDQSIDSLINLGNSAIRLSEEIKETDVSIKKNDNLIDKLSAITKDLEPILINAKSFYNKNEGDQISQIENQILALQVQVRNLEQYRTKVVKSFGIYMNDVIDSIERYGSSLKDKSNVALVYFNKDLKSYFKNVLISIEAIVGPFEQSVKNFQSIVDNLKEFLDVSMIIYGKINEYYEHMTFADYLVNMQSSGDTNYGIYQSNINSFRSSLQFNVVHEMYIKTINSIEQWMFPFSAHILSDLSQLIGPENNKIAAMKDNLIKIERRVESYFSSGQIIDQAIMKMKFSDAEPFYKWTCEDNQEDIERLFKGEMVVFKSNIKNSIKSAVKFNRIEITINSKLQSNLTKVLEENFQVTLRHSGKSYFKYKHLYQMALNDKPFSITFSFKKDSKTGIPVIRNEIYDKMMSGIFSLSPYTSWIIQLQPINNLPYKLDLFNKCDIKINLVGEGTYVDENLIRK